MRVSIGALVFAALAMLVFPGGASAQRTPEDLCFSTAQNSAPAANLAVTAVEASTVQVLDTMGRQRLEGLITCPTGFIRSGATCVPEMRIASASQVTSLQTAQPQSPPSAKEVGRDPQQKQARSPASPSPSQTADRDTWEGRPKGLATWVETFADYERHSRDGLQTQRTLGTTAGIEAAVPLATGALRLGGVGGYSETRQRTSSGRSGPAQFDVDVDGEELGGGPTGVRHQFQFNIPDTPRTVTTDISRRFRSINGGLTASYSIGRFFIDGVAKLERSDISQRGLEVDTAIGFGSPLEYPIIFRRDGTSTAYGVDGEPTGRANDLGCISLANITQLPNGDSIDLGTVEGRAQAIQLLLGQDGLIAGSTTPLNGNASSLSFILANTMGVTYELGNGFIFEPTVGYRYIYTDYSRSGAALGLGDGRALRLEAGGKVSHIDVSRDGTVWINSFGLYAYSDVMVKGFVVAADGSSGSPDEGEIRGRAVLQSRLQMPNGVSYYGEVSGRFGDQYWGVGGKLGMRVEW